MPFEGKRWIRRPEPCEAAAAACDDDLAAGGDQLHPVAELVPEVVGSDGDLRDIRFV
jgi:hypothetical protein